MGGLESGRPSGSGRCAVEACRSIDVNRLHREGCLRPGWGGTWQWQRDGENVASINLRAEVDRLHLSYRVRLCGGDWRMSLRPSLSSSCHAGSEVRGHILSALGGERHRLRKARRRAVPALLSRCQR
jgi:hypothetical protein